MTKEETIRQNMCHAVDRFEWITEEVPSHVYISPKDMGTYVAELAKTEKVGLKLRNGHGPLCFPWGGYMIEIRANPFLLDNTAVCDWQ